MSKYPTNNEMKISTALTDEIETESYKYIDMLNFKSFSDVQKEIVRLAYIAGANKFREILYKSLEK